MFYLRITPGHPDLYTATMPSQLYTKLGMLICHVTEFSSPFHCSFDEICEGTSSSRGCRRAGGRNTRSKGHAQRKSDHCIGTCELVQFDVLCGPSFIHLSDVLCGPSFHFRCNKNLHDDQISEHTHVTLMLRARIRRRINCLCIVPPDRATETRSPQRTYVMTRVLHIPRIVLNRHNPNHS